MKEVLLHIGTHKTGSTTIQRALHGYNDGVTRCAGFQHQNHSIPLYTIFSERRAAYHIWRNQGFTSSRVEALRKKYLAELDRDLADPSHDRLVISGEDISVLATAEKQALLARISDAGLTVKVVVFTRSPLAYVASDTQERVKNGLAPVPLSPGYHHKIAPFVEALGPANVIACDFDAILSGRQDLIEVFSKLAGIVLPPTQAVNQSMSLAALALTRKLDTLPLAVKDKPHRIAARRRLVNRIVRAFDTGAGFEKPPKEIFRALVRKGAENDSHWLAETFGIDYTADLKGESQSTDFQAQLAACLASHVSHITEFLASLDLPANLALEEALLEALVREIEGMGAPAAFDAARYLEFHPDVATSGMNPYEHYLRYGQAEGRQT
ncbi:hypothetical protein [Vannielia sp. SX4]|uniref:hypothetical protein n=1 Tax=Vannielia sp. SX4 TaxID=3463852 RepID=UPI004059ACC8